MILLVVTNLQNEASAISKANDATLAVALFCRALRTVYAARINLDLRMLKRQIHRCGLRGLHVVHHDWSSAINYHDIPLDEEEDADGSDEVPKFFAPLKLLTLNWKTAPKARVTKFSALTITSTRVNGTAAPKYRNTSPWGCDPD